MKQRASESRFDFTGINLSAGGDTLDPHELLQCTNARVLPTGAVQRRAGISKLHVSSIVDAVTVQGLYYFSGQIIAIGSGKVYYSETGGTTWTDVTPTTPIPIGGTVDFAPMLSSGIPQLFFAVGAEVWTWEPNAHVATKRTGVNGVPAATCLRAYGDRMFYGDQNTLTWSKIGEGTNCTVGGVSDGGSALVGITAAEEITHLETVGSSLLIASSNAVSRFTGTGLSVQLDQDTFGVSADIGPVGDSNGFTGSFRRVGDVVMMWTVRGPYVVTEGGVTSLGAKLQTQGEATTTVQWRDEASQKAHIGHDVARNEVWFCYRSEADASVKTALVYNYVTQAWFGPFHFPMELTCAAELADIVGRPMLGGGTTTGFVLNMDDTTVSRDFSSTDFTHTVRLAPTALGAGPFNTKSLRHVFAQVQRESLLTVPVVKVLPDGGALVTATLVSSDSALNKPSNIRYDVAAQAKRFTVEWSGAYADGVDGDLPQLVGVVVEGSVMDRW